MKKIVSNFLFLVTLLASFAGAGCAQDATAKLEVAFNDKGLAKLQYAGQELLGDGRFLVLSADHLKPDGTTQSVWWGDAHETEITFDQATKTLNWKMPWGSVATKYTVKNDRLDLDMTVTNNSDKPLTGINLQPLAIKFPVAPQGWIEGYPVIGANLGAPTINYASFGTGSLAVVNEDTTKPLLVGFPGRALSAERPIMVANANFAGWLQPLIDPYLKRPIAPGESDTYQISLRFGPANATHTQLAGDLNRKFAADHPAFTKWPDRRPMAMLVLSTSSPDHHSAVNPRGWLMDTKLDVKSPEFRARMLQYADNSVKIMKEMNAQGGVVWDVEGQEFPHATSYIGDPRLTPTLAPEMDAIADEFFKKFTDAGLRIGLTLRPQILKRGDDGIWLQHESPDPLQTLREKLAYAHKRWGATLFYVDSNGDPNVPMPAAIFETLAREFPDVLLIPEHENAQYYAATLPFNSFAHFGTTQTSDAVREIYPDAASVNLVADAAISPQQREALLAGVKSGDILMFHGWYSPANNAIIKGIYEEAAKP